MINRGESVNYEICNVADQSVARYARGIITPVELARQIEYIWSQTGKADTPPSHAQLVRIAQKICSRELYTAWCSSNEYLRNCAFDNLRGYLDFLLRNCGYGPALQACEHAVEDVLHSTLEELHRLLQKNNAGPDDPAAFLKWTQTILIRHAYTYLHKFRQEPCLSLDAQIEVYAEQFAATGDSDPQGYVENRELQETLKDAILSIRNRNYQQVLLYTFLAGMEEAELAAHLNVSVQEVYMWRYRALRQLRNNEELMQRLRSLRE